MVRFIIKCSANLHDTFYAIYIPIWLDLLSTPRMLLFMF